MREKRNADQQCAPPHRPHRKTPPPSSSPPPLSPSRPQRGEPTLEREHSAEKKKEEAVGKKEK